MFDVKFAIHWYLGSSSKWIMSTSWCYRYNILLNESIGLSSLLVFLHSKIIGGLFRDLQMYLQLLISQREMFEAKVGTSWDMLNIAFVILWTLLFVKQIHIYVCACMYHILDNRKTHVFLCRFIFWNTAISLCNFFLMFSLNTVRNIYKINIFSG